MTVQHGGPELYEAKRKTLGQDPLRSDADPEKLWLKVPTHTPTLTHPHTHTYPHNRNLPIHSNKHRLEGSFRWPFTHAHTNTHDIHPLTPAVSAVSDFRYQNPRKPLGLY